MIRLILLACLALVGILLVQSDLATTLEQTNIRLAQDDSDSNTQAADPATNSDNGNGDDSGAPVQDQ